MRLRQTAFFVAAIMIAVPAQAQAVSLKDLLGKQSSVERQAQQTQQNLHEAKKNQVSIRQNLQELAVDINETQSRLNKTRSGIEQTNQQLSEVAGQIGQTEQELAKLDATNRQAYSVLYELLVDSYMESMVSNSNVSELVTKGQYLESVQTRLAEDTRKANQLRDQLISQKQQQEERQRQLKAAESELQTDRALLANQQHQQTTVLAANQNAQAKYEQDLKKLAAEHESLSQAIYEARRKQSTRGTEQVGARTSSSYPYSREPNASAADPWLFIKRQCVSYTAWKWLAVYGKTFRNTRPGAGSAWNWPALARDQGYKTSSTPRAGSVVSWPVGPGRPYGHVAWVESVNGDGTINVSEYNWLTPRGYGERRNVNARSYGNPTYIYP